MNADVGRVGRFLRRLRDDADQRAGQAVCRKSVGQAVRAIRLRAGRREKNRLCWQECTARRRQKPWLDERKAHLLRSRLSRRDIAHSVPDRFCRRRAAWRCRAALRREIRRAACRCSAPPARKAEREALQAQSRRRCARAERDPAW